MATVNKTRARSGPRTHENTTAVPITDRLALRRAVVSCLLWEDQFYEEGQEIAARIASLVGGRPAQEVADLAREARTAFKLRHVPLHLARLLANGTSEQRAVVGSLLADVIQRPDELTEFVALYWQGKKQPLSAQAKKGLAKAFKKFSAYQLAKYNQDDAVRLRDVLFLCHAKPKDAEQAATWKQLVDNTLPTPDTWEVGLSAAKGAEEKRAVWVRLLAEGKLGALALLRNLRNMQTVKVSEDTIRAGLAAMKTERVLPFRFVAAATYAPQFEPELESAMFRCVADLPKLGGKTALVVDTSPSMWQANVSAKSEMTRFDAAAALAALCRETCETVNVYAFNERGHRVPARRGFALRDALKATQGNYSRGGLAVDLANHDGYDRLIVLTDGQWHTPEGQRGGEAIALCPTPTGKTAYMVNLASYRNAVGHGPWERIDGWSEAVLDYIRASEAPANVS
jgi:60 kDa SS-A/Ro ribonucleoprotein